jgi:Ca2+/Na+ antiporter
MNRKQKFKSEKKIIITIILTIIITIKNTNKKMMKMIIILILLIIITIISKQNLNLSLTPECWVWPILLYFRYCSERYYCLYLESEKEEHGNPVPHPP